MGSKDDIGTVYKNVEDYLEALEKRHAQEKAPPAAVFMLGSASMMLKQYGGHPWLTRVRCELPTRPLGPGGEEEPVRCTYIGALDEENAEQYQTVVEGMASIDVFKCMHLKAKPAHPVAIKRKPGPGPSAKALAHLEQSDIVVIGDGPYTDHAWFALQEGGDGLMDRIKWRYYCGAVLIGLGNGCQFLGKRWWVGSPVLEVESNHLMVKGLPIPKRSEDEKYNTGKASEIVPAFFATDSKDAEALCELQGAVAAAVVLPKEGACVFNVDGTLEPACAMLMEHCWDWKQKRLKTYMLSPPDEKTNVLKCAEYVERRKAKVRAKRLAMGLDPDGSAPVDLDGDENDEDDEEEEDEDDDEREKRAEADREAVRTRRLDKVSPFVELEKRKREEAETERQRGADYFKQGKWERALECFEKALEKAPEDYKCHLNRAATLLKLERPRRAVLAADRALHLCQGREAKAWYRRAACWLATGEFNECIADCDKAKSLEPADKAIKELRERAEKEREDETWSFASDCRKVEKQREKEEEEEAAREARLLEEGEEEAEGGGAAAAAAEEGSGTQMVSAAEAIANLGVIAARTMMDIEVFNGNVIELVDGVLTMRWLPTRDDPDGHEEVVKPARLDIRAMFCIEEATKKACVSSLAIKGACLGAWGAAFVARGARIEGAGLEKLHLVDCRLREAGAKSVASLLSRGSRLVEVDLSGNQIGDDGMFELARELKKNEYLESLTLQRNRIVGNRRLATVAEAISEHPTLRVLDLAHNKIGFQGACHLATGLQATEVLQRLSLAHNKFKADGLHRLCHVAVGHPSLATIDLRGVYLRASDRRRLEAHTRFTRLQIFIDAAQRKTEEEVERMANLDEGASTWGPSPLDHRVHERSQKKVKAPKQAEATGAPAAAEDDEDGPAIEENDEVVAVDDDNEAGGDDGPEIEDITELELELRKARKLAAADAERIANDPAEQAKAATIAKAHEARKRQELKDVEIVPSSLLTRPDVNGDVAAAAAPTEPAEDVPGERSFDHLHESPDEIKRRHQEMDAKKAEREAAEAQRKLDELHDLSDHVWLFEFSKLGLY